MCVCVAGRGWMGGDGGGGEGLKDVILNEVIMVPVW